MLHVLSANPRLQCIVGEDLFIQRWTDNGTTDDLRALIREHRRYLQERAPRKTCSLAHVRIRSLASPDDANRALIAEHQTLLAGQITASIVWLDINPFASAIVHGVATATAALRPRSSTAMKTVRSALDAFSLYLERRESPASDVAAASLVREYDQLQSTLGG
jgi:hypothetical protein